MRSERRLPLCLQMDLAGSGHGGAEAWRSIAIVLLQIILKNMTAATYTLPPPSFLKLLAHELRWSLLEALARSDRRVQELVEMVGEPANLVSYHLRRLRDQALVRERRSAADGRDVYYSVDLERLRGLYFAMGESLHPGFSESSPEQATGTTARSSRPARVLFLCT